MLKYHILIEQIFTLKNNFQIANQQASFSYLQICTQLFSYYADIEAFPIKLRRENIYNKNCQGIWNSFLYFLDNSNLITIEILEVKKTWRIVQHTITLSRQYSNIILLRYRCIVKCKRRTYIIMAVTV